MAYQVSIFLENKTGHFEKVTRIFRENGINIRSMTLNNTANGWGILNLLVDKPTVAVEVLSAAGMSASLRPILAFEMKDQPGGLDDILVKIAAAGVNFQNAYGRVLDMNKKALLFIDVEDYELALQQLVKNEIYPLEDEVVYK
jgi:hypothetical protein